MANDQMDVWYIIHLLRNLYNLYRNYQGQLLQRALHYGVEYGVIPKAVEDHPRLLTWGLALFSSSTFLPVVVIGILLYTAPSIIRAFRDGATRKGAATGNQGSADGVADSGTSTGVAGGAQGLQQRRGRADAGQAIGASF